jgi:prepilin-type N-terminal cleavage/methylation domain-containing protein
MSLQSKLPSPESRRIFGCWLSAIGDRLSSRPGARPRPSRFTLLASRPHGFTLIEIMAVIGIMALVLTMGVPIVYKTWHKEALTKAVTDIVEVLSNARARAILQSTRTEVVFHPKAGRLEISGGGASQPSTYTGGGIVEVGTPGLSASGTSAQLSPRVLMEMVDVNLTEYRDADEARVRFYPDGRCDELTVILVSDSGERREIFLEITTSLANVESNPLKFR